MDRGVCVGGVWLYNITGSHRLTRTGKLIKNNLSKFCSFLILFSHCKGFQILQIFYFHPHSVPHTNRVKLWHWFSKCPLLELFLGTNLPLLKLQLVRWSFTLWYIYNFYCGTYWAICYIQTLQFIKFYFKKLWWDFVMHWPIAIEMSVSGGPVILCPVSEVFK